MFVVQQHTDERRMGSEALGHGLEEYASFLIPDVITLYAGGGVDIINFLVRFAFNLFYAIGCPLHVRVYAHPFGMQVSGGGGGMERRLLHVAYDAALFVHLAA